MDRFVTPIWPYLHDCPKAIIKAEVLKAAIQFCLETWIWQQDAEKEVLADADEITFTIPDDSTITGAQLSIDGKAFNEYTRSGTTITLDDAVTTDTTFQTTVFLVPTRNADALPDLLYDTWFVGIEALAKAQLKAMPNKPWSDPNGLGLEYRTYAHEMGEARIKARKTNDQTDLKVYSREFV